jgi:hypothetical protein
MRLMIPTEYVLCSTAILLNRLADPNNPDPGGLPTQAHLPPHLRAGSSGILSNKVFISEEVDGPYSPRLTVWAALLEGSAREDDGTPLLTVPSDNKALLISTPVESLKQLPDAMTKNKHWPSDVVLC